jgi:hypothetical protein
MAVIKRNRIYVETSVFGGVFDSEFAEISLCFFTEVREGKHIIVVSEVTAGELLGAPEIVRHYMAEIPQTFVEELAFTEEMAQLRDAYLAAHVLAPRWRDDAAHVAAASVARVDLIVSWNFRHLVKWQKMRAFNAVNIRLGYPLITILSPREVIADA